MKRTIAAILAADVAGYSRLMAEDEEDTLVRLAAAKIVFVETVAQFNGRVFNTAGDAILAEFPSAVEALRAGISIQRALDDRDRDARAQRRVRFRMGLNIGDVVEVEGDLLGDGVNIASRLEGIAEPGGICVSRSLHEAVSGKVHVTFRDIGPQKLKNLPRPVHAFRVVMPAGPAGAAAPNPGPAPGWLIVRRCALAGMLLVPMAVAGFWYAGRVDGRKGGHGAAMVAEVTRENLVSASVVRATKACFPDEIRLTGRLAPRRGIEVRPGTGGLDVVRVLAQPLDSVWTGQALAELRQPGAQDRRLVTVRSPVDGLITRVGASDDGSGSTGVPPLFRIAADASFELRAEAPWPVLARIRPGQEAAIMPLGRRPQPGRVRLVAPSLDPATQLGSIYVQFDTGDGAEEPLRAGQFATALVRIGERCGVAVPASAIMHAVEGPVVYVSRSRDIEVRPVVTGLSKGRQVEIRDGLDERDMIIARAGAFLREGDVITPIVAELR